MRLTPDTWIISDTHLFHDNIIRHCQWPDNHDALMFENWKRVVKKPAEDVLHLGDICWFPKLHSSKVIDYTPVRLGELLEKAEKVW